MSEKEFSRSKEKGTGLYLFILLNEKKMKKLISDVTKVFLILY